MEAPTNNRPSPLASLRRWASTGERFRFTGANASVSGWSLLLCVAVTQFRDIWSLPPEQFQQLVAVACDRLEVPGLAGLLVAVVQWFRTGPTPQPDQSDQSHPDQYQSGRMRSLLDTLASVEQAQQIVEDVKRDNDE